VQDEHLPPTVGLGVLDQLPTDVHQAFELVAPDQVGDQLVVLTGGGMVPERPALHVRVTVIRARDQGDATVGIAGVRV